MGQPEHPIDDDRLLRALGAEIMRVSARRTTAYAGSVLDSSAFRILWVLSESGPMTLRELSEELQLERSTINRQVNAAIRHGHLERLEDEGSVAPRVRPTDEGRAAYLHDGRLRGAAYSRALADLGVDRAGQMVDTLRDFNDSLDRAHDRADERADGQQPGTPSD